MSRPIEIGIAEDHIYVRQGLVALLKEYDSVEVIFDVNNGQELLKKLKSETPDIVLLDIDMPVMGGAEAFEIMKMLHPQIKVIILSIHFTASYIIEFIRKGARGFLPKNSDIGTIIEALETVYEKGYYFDTKVGEVVAKAINSPGNEAMDEAFLRLDITGRELQVLKLVCNSKTNKEIADLLNLSIRTVEWHRSNAMKKTNCSSPAELAVYIIQKFLAGIE